ncbi:MAG TPA: DUF2894 domain-containing protein [Burkholderiaceae bacterium]
MNADAVDGLDAGVDPVRFRFIEALARRAQAQPDGEARRLLDERIAGLVAAYREMGARTASASTAAQPVDSPARGPLAALVDRLAQRADPPREAAEGSPSDSTSPAELKALEHFRSTWSRLDADRRLTQSLATVPDKAGPLNSHHLVHRSLSVMRELSPAYLHRFMAYVDALFWLDAAG